MPGVNNKTYHVLSAAVAMCFIGYGAFGIITKAVWCNYFAVVGIGPELSYQLMPVIGCFDILLGLLMLVYPVKAIPAWIIIWGAVTALLRPLSGEPLAEFLERAGNYGTPLSLIVLTGTSANIKDWFTHVTPAMPVNAATVKRVTACLKMVVFLLLCGHGWLNLLEKGALLKQYSSLGFSSPGEVAHLIGFAEISAGCIVLVKPFRTLLFVIFIWKMSTEVFYPYYAVFEWLERGGSYGAILALWMITAPSCAAKYSLPGNFALRKLLQLQRTKIFGFLVITRHGNL